VNWGIVVLLVVAEVVLLWRDNRTLVRLDKELEDELRELFDGESDRDVERRFK
jgi:hypothetical protein